MGYLPRIAQFHIEQEYLRGNMKIIYYLIFIVILSNYANADYIQIIPSSNEIAFETFGSKELGFDSGTCGDNYCDIAENSIICPLDCPITAETPIGLTGGSAGATLEQLIKIPENITIIEEIIEEVKKPFNYTLLFIVSTLIFVFLWRRSRRKLKKAKKKTEEKKKEEKGVLDFMEKK